MYLTAKYQKINGHIYWPLSRKQKFDQLAIKSKKVVNRMLQNQEKSAMY